MLLALLVMPFQGIAATLTVLLCHGDAQAHSTHSGAGHDASHDAGDHSAAHQQDYFGSGYDADGGSNNSTLYHLCCNLTASVPPSITVNTELPDFSVQAFAPKALHDLFVPEQPQRPPLA